MNMDFKLTETNKGKKAIILDGYIYRLCYSSKICNSWRCSIKGALKCSARIKTTCNNDTILTWNVVHTHSPDYKKTERQELRTRIKRKATEDIATRPAKVIRTELESFSEEYLTVSDTRNIALALYRQKRKKYPALPKNRSDIHHALDHMTLETNKNEQFLLKNDHNSGVVIFGCTTNMQILCQVDEIFIDGTFKNCAKFFYQMYTVHGLKNGHFVPLLFILLPSKSEAIYRYLWTTVLELCVARNFVLSSLVIQINFEAAMITVVKEFFPFTSILCCRFHLGQAWWRKMQAIGLAPAYKDRETDVSKWLHVCFGLHFQPPYDIEDAFAEEVMSELLPDDRKCHTFADYLLDNYVTSDSRFPPIMWARAPSHCKRTNNATESFHAHFNQQFYSAHPCIFVFVDVIKKIQCITYIKIRSLDSEAPIRKGDREKIQFFMDQYAKYRNGVITRRKFMISIGYRIQPSSL